MSTDPTNLNVDFMILADGAQAVGGKLYMLGGGWDRLLVPKLPGPPQAPYSVAVAINVPYSMTNRRFGFALQLVNADGDPLGDTFTVEFEAGRPPGMRPGSKQAILLAANTRPDFPAPGMYSYNASIDGEPLRSVSFEVVLQTPGPQPRPE